MSKFAVLWNSQKNRSAFPSLVDYPEGQQVLVLAPHPDDDVLGCGGTLLKHKKSGHMIMCIYLTDGSFGDPDFEDRAALVQERELESGRAAQIIGISKYEFLREKDQNLKCTEGIIQRLDELFEKIKPDLVYLPFFLDNHPDHIVTNAIFYQVVKGGKARFRCCFYETWTPLIPNILVDISEEMDMKIRAIEEFKTQLKHFDYIRVCKGLNAYRSMLFEGKGTYAEAFYRLSAEEYASLFRIVWGDKWKP